MRRVALLTTGKCPLGLPDGIPNLILNGMDPAVRVVHSNGAIGEHDGA